MSVTDHDKISLRAFQIWEAEGRPVGLELEHWLRAEIELRVVPVPVRTKSLPETAEKPAAVRKNGLEKPKAAKAAPPKAAKPAAKAAKAPKAVAPKRGGKTTKV